MKKIAFAIVMGIGILLSGCGLTDPWKEWENSGNLPEDRMLPSDVLQTLCAADWWKFDYEGETFYFRFYDDGTAISNSTLLRDELTTEYHFNWDNAYSVELTINEGGHLGYLESGNETEFLITAYSATSVTSTGVNTGAEFDFVSTSSDEVDAMVEEKAEEVARVEATQRIIDAGLDYGAVYSGSDFVAHYYMDFSDENSYTVRFDLMDDGVLTHQTLDIEVDINSVISFATGTTVTVDGNTVTGMAFSDGAMSLIGAESLTVNSNTASANWYSGVSSGYSTYMFNGTKGDASADLKAEFQSKLSEWNQVELSDRTGRPLFFCPAITDDGRWYVGIYSNSAPEVDSVQRDIVHFDGGTRGDMSMGGDTKWIDYILTNYPELMDFYFNEAGIVVVNDSASTLVWLLSPVNGDWIMGAK